jgi:hypothetical protein
MKQKQTFEEWAENLSDRDRGRITDYLIAKSRIEVPSSEVPIQPEQNAQDPRSTRPDLVADWDRVPSPPNSESRVGSSRSRAEAPAGPAGRAWWQIFHNPRFTPHATIARQSFKQPARLLLARVFRLNDFGEAKGLRAVSRRWKNFLIRLYSPTCSSVILAAGR